MEDGARESVLCCPSVFLGKPNSACGIWPSWPCLHVCRSSSTFRVLCAASVLGQRDVLKSCMCRRANFASHAFNYSLPASLGELPRVMPALRCRICKKHARTCRNRSFHTGERLLAELEPERGDSPVTQDLHHAHIRVELRSPLEEIFRTFSNGVSRSWNP